MHDDGARVAHVSRFWFAPRMISMIVPHVLSIAPGRLPSRSCQSPRSKCLYGIVEAGKGCPRYALTAWLSLPDENVAQARYILRTVLGMAFG